MTGSDSEIDFVPYEKAYGPGFEDMERRCPNISKLKKTIQFEPSYDLESIIQSVIDYKELRFSGFFQKAESEIPVGVAAALTDEDEIEPLDTRNLKLRTLNI